MYAIEFQTELNNGIIKVPNEFLTKLHNKVRVIVLDDEIDNEKKFEFNAIKIKTKDFKFNRDEANAR